MLISAEHTVHVTVHVRSTVYVGLETEKSVCGQGHASGKPVSLSVLYISK